ncbi:MAG TPA: hypothetical protein VEI94_08895 [Candidatus Bathyarchaeia archaeon]|nr:hypothetical protein [Candidatus Bathyarchaeia archaeon]
MMTIDFTHALSGIFYLGVALIVVSAAGIICDSIQNRAQQRAQRVVKLAARGLQHAS